MARLIDADKLMNDIAEHITVKAVSRVLAIIQGQPTVEAIPKEWIKKWVGKNVSDPINATWNTYTLTMLEGMLEDWEKENENNSNN